MDLPYFSIIRWGVFIPKLSQKRRFILSDGSRSLGLFRKGKTCIIAKFHRTDLLICSHSRGEKTLSCSWINTGALWIVYERGKLSIITEERWYMNDL